MNEQPKRRVALIGTGGTISSIGRDSLDVWEYMDTGQKIGPDDLVARYPETAGIADIVPVPFRSVGSSFIGPRDWLALAETIRAAAAREASFAGVVIMYGMATLEETAYFLNLAVRVAGRAGRGLAAPRSLARRRGEGRRDRTRGIALVAARAGANRIHPGTHPRSNLLREVHQCRRPSPSSPRERGQFRSPRPRRGRGTG